MLWNLLFFYCLNTITDVPNFLQEEGEVSTVGGSHQDILVGRQGPSPSVGENPQDTAVGEQLSPSPLFKLSSDSKKTYVLQLNSNEVESKDNLTTMKLLTRKPKKKLKGGVGEMHLTIYSFLT